MTAPRDPFAQQSNPAPYGSPYGTPQGYGPPPQPQAGWQAPPQTEVKAMIALGLAIAAYTPTIPFIGAIAAIVLARMARRDILASGGARTGLSLCTWATVLSVVHLVLVGLLFLVLLAVFLLPFSFL